MTLVYVQPFSSSLPTPARRDEAARFREGSARRPTFFVQKCRTASGTKGDYRRRVGPVDSVHPRRERFKDDLFPSFSPQPSDRSRLRETVATAYLPRGTTKRHSRRRSSRERAIETSRNGDDGPADDVDVPRDRRDPRRRRHRRRGSAPSRREKWAFTPRAYGRRSGNELRNLTSLPRSPTRRVDGEQPARASVSRLRGSYRVLPRVVDPPRSGAVQVRARPSRDTPRSFCFSRDYAARSNRHSRLGHRQASTGRRRAPSPSPRFAPCTCRGEERVYARTHLRTHAPRRSRSAETSVQPASRRAGVRARSAAGSLR